MVGTSRPLKAARLPFVLIPLKSGHGWHINNRVTSWQMECLNPFEIRAWLAQGDDREISDNRNVLIPLKSGHGWHGCYRCEKRKGGVVLIPLNSGHGWHTTARLAAASPEVLIPLKSGHGWHIHPLLGFGHRPLS